MVYSMAKSVLIHLFTKDDFIPIWEKWVEDCKSPGALPMFDNMKAMIFKYTNAKEIFTHNEIDIYYPSVYMRIAKDEYFINDFDAKLKLL